MGATDVVTGGTVVLEIGVSLFSVSVVVASSAIEVDGMTSPVTDESSVYLDGKQEPAPLGAVPIAATMDDTRTWRPAAVG